jgi:hypothetical protein
MNRSGFPRGKDELLREVDLRIRLTDIRKLYETKYRLAPKWWEGLILLLLFAAALGLLASLVQYARSTGSIIDNWMVFWFGLMVMTVVFSFEFLLIKIYALRRANELVVRILEDVRARQDAIELRLNDISKSLAGAEVSAPEIPPAALSGDTPNPPQSPSAD